MSDESALKKTGNFIRNSATFKMISIGILVLVLLIPTAMVSSLVKERQVRRNSVVREINQKWGYSQTITGPFFTVPYKVFYRTKDDQLKFNIHYLHILPEHLRFSGKVSPEVRYRSIYETVLYNTKIAAQGTFVLPKMERLNIDPDTVLWEKALFSIGINDMKGIQKTIDIDFDGLNYPANPGLKTKDVARAGVHSVIPLSPSNREHTFHFSLDLNGSQSLSFTPLAKETKVKLESPWPSPSFYGTFLPAERTIGDDGFKAQWKVLHLNRNYPQFWTGGQYNVSGSSFGLSLHLPANVYQKSMRITKYSVLFVVFTFAAFFFSEILNKKRIHPIQYLLIGLSILLFYILLLSLSEHIGFGLSYFFSAATITLLITAYSRGILRSSKFTPTVFSILSILYLYLYITLQLEDFALILGSFGLLTILGTVMYITRKVDWYSIDYNQQEE